jgi:hypothetical protein
MGHFDRACIVTPEKYVFNQRINRTFNQDQSNMKSTIFFTLAIATALLSSCSTNNNVLPTAPAPYGTFTGQFKLYHINPATNTARIDSAYIDLSLETATGFKVTGDTLKLHAGSYGNYLGNAGSMQIEFADKTAPTSGTPTKVHLNGIYQYSYNGNILQLLAYGPQDTLQYYYKFTRTGN